MRYTLIVLGLFGALFGYTGWSVLAPLPWPAARATGAALLAVAYAASVWVPLVYWRQEGDETTLRQRRVLWAAFAGMGFLSFALVLTAARDLASLLPGVTLRTETGSVAVLALSALGFGLGLLGAHGGVAVRRVRVPLPGLPAALEGLRIVQITDLHVGPTIRREFVEKVVRLANEARPDLIVVTGDLVDGMPSDLAPEVAPLSGLRAPLGKFYCTGNHEYYWDGPGWIARCRALGLEPLVNEHRVIERGGARLALAGVPDPAARMAGGAGPDFVAAARGIPEGVAPRIVLCHQPGFAEAAERAGFDLQISGHTHGGQFFPWTLVAARVHRHNYGLHRLARMAIYVSRGTGYWGPPVRLGAPAEVTLLELRAASVPSLRVLGSETS